jgi:hypothetical protein
MNARTLGALAAAVLVSLALACERGTFPSAPLASKGARPASNFSASDDEREIRWDLFSLNFSNGNVSAGGTASALDNEGSKLTLTGSGTFKRGEEDEVTGGGTWKIEKTGMATVTGTYRVTDLVRFEHAAGTFPAGLVDRIGSAADARAGLAIVQIKYSDRSRGILVVSCEIVGSPHGMFEGITASKGSTTFWNRVAPVAGVDENRTLFHVINDENDEEETDEQD